MLNQAEGWSQNDCLDELPKPRGQLAKSGLAFFFRNSFFFLLALFHILQMEF